MSFEDFSFDDEPPLGAPLSAAEVLPSGTPSSTDNDSWAFVASRVTGGGKWIGQNGVGGQWRSSGSVLLWCCVSSEWWFLEILHAACRHVSGKAHQAGRSKGSKHTLKRQHWCRPF
jgi:hypothetical protein